jgi:hypothetical protein
MSNANGQGIEVEILFAIWGLRMEGKKITTNSPLATEPRLAMPPKNIKTYRVFAQCARLSRAGRHLYRAG